MTTSRPRPGGGARAERRILVQLSVAAISMATLAVSWLGIATADRDGVAQPADGMSAAIAVQPVEGQTSLVPAPQTSGAGTVIRRSRAS